MQTTIITWAPESGWSTDPAGLRTRPGQTLALAFCSPDVDPPLDALRDALGGVDVVACSTAGQILGRELDAAPVVAAVIVFETGKVVSACMERDRHPEDIGGALAGELIGATGTEHVAGVLVFGGGLDINGQALVRGMQQVLPSGTSLSGGLAGDGSRFEDSWVYCNGSRGPRLVAAVAVVGERIHFALGSQGGWDGFGPRRTISHSSGNTLYELDGRPALSLYKEYLGERAAELPASAMLFPLGITEKDGDTTLVRTVLAVDEQQQSMTFAGDVPQGWQGRLMWTTKDDLIDGAEEAAQQVAHHSYGIAIAVSCVGRRLALANRADEEPEALADALGEDVPLVGFYSYGEIASIDGVYSLHNQTMTITTICEDGE